jgi:hypothetical protein
MAAGIGGNDKINKLKNEPGKYDLIFANSLIPGYRMAAQQLTLIL